MICLSTCELVGYLRLVRVSFSFSFYVFAILALIVVCYFKCLDVLFSILNCLSDIISSVLSTSCSCAYFSIQRSAAELQPYTIVMGDK